MRKIEGYQCDNCKRLFQTEKEASLCESDHQEKLKNAVIASMKFKNTEGKYGLAGEFDKNVPASVLIKFSQMAGDYARYTLEHYGPRGL